MFHSLIPLSILSQVRVGLGQGQGTGTQTLFVSKMSVKFVLRRQALKITQSFRTSESMVLSFVMRFLQTMFEDAWCAQISGSKVLSDLVLLTCEGSQGGFLSKSALIPYRNLLLYLMFLSSVKRMLHASWKCEMSEQSLR